MDQWEEFKQAAEAAGMDGSPVDWNDARSIIWRGLDFEQRAAAIRGLVVRTGLDDPATKALPINYLQKRMWERKPRHMGRKQAATLATRGRCQKCDGSGIAGFDWDTQEKLPCDCGAPLL